jgi:class 3 adenylate cyclase/tetratricopeptide (TPR) repeat protein
MNAEGPIAQAAVESPDPGRRFVTLVFADLSRSTELAALMEAEHYAALLGGLRRAYDEIVPRHGGIVVRVQGDGLLAMFGYPQSRGDDVRRALQATLELHAHARSLPVVLPPGFVLRLHSGVHGGLVLVRAGDIERGRFELTGSVPNIAARLAETARADEVVVSAETLGPAARHFRVADEEALAVRGRDEPIRVLRVQGQAAGAAEGRGASVGPAGLVGREAELELLGQALQEAAQGALRVVAIAGAPGLGKTRLAQGLAERADALGWRVLRTHCDESLDAEPMQPFAQLLRALQEPPAQTLAQAAAATCALLARLAAQQPLLLFIDDWHWADDAAQQVLLALRRLPPPRLLIVLTTRQPPEPQDLQRIDRTLPLAPLADAQAAQLAGALLGPVDPFVVAQVCRHAGGNPLFIGELCHSVTRARLRDAQWVQLSDAAASPALERLHNGAGFLGQLVDSRLQALPLEQAELLRAAAVIGNVVPLWLLEQLSGHAADSAALAALAEQDFLHAGAQPGMLRFKHGLARDVIYAGIGLPARQNLHLRVAAALLHQQAGKKSAEVDAALAHHFAAGGDSVLASHYAELAGDQALAASALDRARAQYRAALAALDRLPPSAARVRRWVEIVQRLGLVSVYDGTSADLAMARRALALAERSGDALLAARARHWLGYIHYGLGDMPDAVQHCAGALDGARAAGDRRLTLQTVAALGQAYTGAACYAQALPLLDEVIAVRRRGTGRTDALTAFTIVCRAWVLGDRGEFDAAEAAFADALQCLAGDDHEIGSTIHGWHAAVLLWRGHWERARRVAAESARIALGTRSLAQYSIAEAIGAWADWQLQRRPEAIARLEQATAWLAPRETGLYRSLNHGWLSEAWFALGRRDDARRAAAMALHRARRSDWLGVAMSQRALALDALASGQPALAQRRLAAAYATARRRESAHELALTQCAEARLLLAAGRRGEALRLLDAADAAFGRMDMPWHAARARALRDGAADQAGVSISSTGEPVGRSVPASNRPDSSASSTPTPMP